MENESEDNLPYIILTIGLIIVVIFAIYCLHKLLTRLMNKAKE